VRLLQVEIITDPAIRASRLGGYSRQKAHNKTQKYAGPCHHRLLFLPATSAATLRPRARRSPGLRSRLVWRRGEDTPSVRATCGGAAGGKGARGGSRVPVPRGERIAKPPPIRYLLLLFRLPRRDNAWGETLPPSLNFLGYFSLDKPNMLGVIREPCPRNWTNRMFGCIIKTSRA
jgi:hypothetical protein